MASTFCDNYGRRSYVTFCGSYNNTLDSSCFPLVRFPYVRYLIQVIHHITGKFTDMFFQFVGLRN